MFLLRSAFWLTVMFLIIAPKDFDLGKAASDASAQALRAGRQAVVQQVLAGRLRLYRMRRQQGRLCGAGRQQESLHRGAPTRDGNSGPAPPTATGSDGVTQRPRHFPTLLQTRSWPSRSALPALRLSYGA